jgi:hypothetical protein
MLHVPLIHPDLFLAHEYMLDACLSFCFLISGSVYSEADSRSAGREGVLT